MKIGQKNTEHDETEDVSLLLGRIDGKKILDVATGLGANIDHLINSLKSYEEIIGIDIERPEKISAYGRESIFKKENVKYVQMDAGRLEFEDNSFDTVSIGNSLHHLDDPAKVLSEMIRVLNKKGCAIISEMYRDELSPESTTHVLTHHWWAEIDSSLGVIHKETYKRCELVDMVERAGFEENKYFDILDSDSDPFEKERMKYFTDAIEKYLHKAEPLQNFTCIEKKAKDLRERIYRVGIRWGPVLLAVCRKQL